MGNYFEYEFKCNLKVVHILVQYSFERNEMDKRMPGYLFGKTNWNKANIH